MKPRNCLVLLALCALTSAACNFQASGGEQDSPGTNNESESVQSTGIALSMNTVTSGNVVGIRFQIAKCENPNENIIFNQVKSLEDLKIPGGIPEFINRPFDENSAHLFSDYFVVLDAGCYHIAATPVDINGAACTECSQAIVRNIQVYDGLTTEILLVSQCVGPERGALDVVGALNHPPVLEGLAYEPSKFVYECEETILCATASDPDNDPIEFVWKKKSGQKLFGDTGTGVIDSSRVYSRTEEHGHVTECLRIAPQWQGDYELEVFVYDHFRLDNGDLVRAEEFVGQNSHASLSFPLYSSWSVDYQCYDAETQTLRGLPGVRDIQLAPGCNPTGVVEYYCSSDTWNNTDMTCPGGVFLPETVYPACQQPNGQAPL